MVEDLIGYVPNIVQALLPFAVGAVAVILYAKTRRIGFVLVGIALFLLIIPNIIRIGLGGPYIAERLLNQGYPIQQIALYQFYLFLMDIAFEVSSAILAIAGLYVLSKK